MGGAAGPFTFPAFTFLLGLLVLHWISLARLGTQSYSALSVLQAQELSLLLEPLPLLSIPG